ncbi:MAG TPA: protein-disulfide reductase DsbD domain-containing protein [Vineibacter sp.]|nr:protein-disulfide reductase DsbD domain-containing protein [Vineibacter sp.]
MLSLAAVAVALACGAPAHADGESAPVVTERTRASLVTDGAAVAPGASAPVALRLRLKPGWHTYWRNPGDSGEPPAVRLRVGDRDVEGPAIWPIPERIDIAGIVSYGHHGDVKLVTMVPIPASAVPGSTVRIEAEARWLVCEKVCVPEQGRFALDVPVAASAAPTAKERAGSLYPPTLPRADAIFAPAGGNWTLRAVPAPSAGGDAAVTSAYFFPERGDQIDHSAPQAMRVADGAIALDLALTQPAPPLPESLRGVLAVTRASAGGAPQVQYFEIAARPETASR